MSKPKRKRKVPNGIPDKWAFQNLNSNIMTTERKTQLGDFLIQYGYKLKNDTSGKTTTDIMKDFKSILLNLKKLNDTNK